jgi:hypothetical protein
MHGQCMASTFLSMKKISEGMGYVWRKIKSIWRVYQKTALKYGEYMLSIPAKYGLSMRSIWIVYRYCMILHCKGVLHTPCA